jgi:hypothetical protein
LPGKQYSKVPPAMGLELGVQLKDQERLDSVFIAEFMESFTPLFKPARDRYVFRKINTTTFTAASGTYSRSIICL